MKFNKIEKVIKKTEMECKVLGATILTEDEYKQYRHLIPLTKDWWWLRSPRGGSNGLAIATSYGTVSYATYSYTLGYVRPALRLKISNYKSFVQGDKIELKNISYTVLDIIDGVVLVLSDEIIARRQFDGTSNQWETSELKAYLEDWARQEFGMMMMSEELKPCPFCGCKAEIISEGTCSGHNLIWVECVECNCRTSGYEDNEKEAIKRWNRRVADER